MVNFLLSKFYLNLRQKDKAEKEILPKPLLGTTFSHFIFL